MIAVSLRSIVRSDVGRYYATFTDGTQLEVAERAEMLNLARADDTSPDFARRLMLAWWLVRDPTAAAAATLVVGKTMTFDLGQTNPIRVL